MAEVMEQTGTDVALSGRGEGCYYNW